MPTCKICVLGAGVIGLSSAVRVLELHPNAEVIVIADRFTPNTTSDVSGGFWEPHLLGDTPEEKIRQWSYKTFEHMTWLADTDCAKYTGACMVSGYHLTADPNDEPPFWKDRVKNFRLLTKEEIKEYDGMGSGSFYTTVMLEPRLYLQWLMKRFQRQGGRLKKQYLSNLDELADGDYDIIINCTGVGANHLVNDSSVQPVRGQVIRVIAPWIKTHYDFQDRHGNDFYILPGANYVVMGGVQYQGDWNTEVSQTDKKTIWDNCIKYVPSLQEASLDGDAVGLRPSRPTVRLEVQDIHIRGKMTSVIHNYGHGAVVSRYIGAVLKKCHTLLVTQSGRRRRRYRLNSDGYVLSSLEVLGTPIYQCRQIGLLAWEHVPCKPPCMRLPVNNLQKM